MSKKAQEAEAYAEVKKLFLTTNRPYSLQMVVNALGSKFGKTVVNKALDKLTEEDILEVMDVGKSSKIWTPNQKLFPVLSQEELDEKKMALTNIESQIAEAKANILVLNRTLNNLTSYPTTSNLQNNVEDLKKTRDEKMERLNASGPTVTEEEFRALKTKLLANLKVWKSRRMVVKDVIDQMSEGMEKKPKELFDTIGLEVDGTGPGETTLDLDHLTK